MQQDCDSVRTAAPFFGALSAHETKTSISYNEKHLLKCPLLVLSTAMSDHLLLLDVPLAPGHPRPPKWGAVMKGGHKEEQNMACWCPNDAAQCKAVSPSAQSKRGSALANSKARQTC